jgi:hypothetical protein
MTVRTRKAGAGGWRMNSADLDTRRIDKNQIPKTIIKICKQIMQE